MIGTTLGKQKGLANWQDAIVGQPEQEISAQPERLQYGFDMKPKERIGFHFRVPPRNGVDGKNERLPAHQQKYLFDRITLGMNILNRELSPKNILVLTEALGLSL